MRTVSLFTLALAATALVATACGERAEPTGKTVPLFPVTVSRSGATPIVLERQPRRVAAVTPSAVSVVSALAGERGHAPIVLRLSENVDSQELHAFKPDLIVASPEAGQGALERASRATKAPVYVFPESSIGDVEQGMTDLGLLLGRQLEARRLVHAIEEKRSLVRKHVEGTGEVGVFVDTGFFVTVPANSLVGQLVDEAGGRDVVGVNAGVGPFDLTRLARLKPDFYLATSDSGTTLRDLRKNPRTRRLPAVRKGRFAVVSSSLIEAGPKIGEGLETIAKLLHPGAFQTSSP